MELKNKSKEEARRYRKETEGGQRQAGMRPGRDERGGMGKRKGKYFN